MIMNTNEIYVIAEIGVNHNGSVELAKELILKAKEAGANAVKFQTFTAEEVLSEQASMAAYQKVNTGQSTSQLEMVKKLELSFLQTKEIQCFCKEQGITFVSTPFDSQSLKFLVEELDVPYLKVSSADISNLPFLYEIACTGKPVILSTGTASLGDIEQALSVFAFVEEHGAKVKPSRQGFRESYAKMYVRNAIKQRVMILHCVTQYPAIFTECNLRALSTLQQAFGTTVGFSDHTLDEYAAIISLSLGARIFEKHITLDKKMEGPDHAASMECDEFKHYVDILQKSYIALGDGVKFMQEQEKDNFLLVRRTLVARQDIKQGDLFTSDNVVAKRAGQVMLAPEFFWELIGSTATKDYQINDVIERL